jgi:hypothetical protein
MHVGKKAHVNMRKSHVNMRKVNMRFFPKIHVRNTHNSEKNLMLTLTCKNFMSTCKCFRNGGTCTACAAGSRDGIEIFRFRKQKRHFYKKTRSIL